MKHNAPLLFAAAMALPLFAADTLDLPPFGTVRVLDAIDCATEEAHGFAEYPEGASRVETILGRPCRVMPVQATDSSFLSYRLGRG